MFLSSLHDSYSKGFILRVVVEDKTPLPDMPDGQPEEPDELNEHVRDPGDPDGIIAAEQQQRWQETHPEPRKTPEAVYRPKKVWPKVFVGLIVFAVAAYGAYWFGNYEADKNTSQPSTSTSVQKSQKATTSNDTTIPTENYTSTNYTMSFSYPKTWTVSDTTARLTVTSPVMQLTVATGTKVKGRVVFTVQNPVASIAGYPADGAVASLASDHLTYAQPSTVQRAQTYLSYLGFSTSNGLDAIYVTGDNGYQQGQSIPMSDIVKGNPLISVMFDSCGDENCTSIKPITVNTNSWQASSASKDVTKMIESVVLQG